MTLSLIAHEPATGAFGIVICSSSPAVAARCAHLRPGVGVVASQNITNPALGTAVLDEMAVGANAADALANALSRERFPDHRQVTAVGADGTTAVHSGSQSLGVYGHIEAENVVAAGNLLADESVLTELVTGYTRSRQNISRSDYSTGYVMRSLPAVRPARYIRPDCSSWPTSTGRSPICGSISPTTQWAN